MTVKLLEIGDKMIERLIGLITAGYGRDVPEVEMVNSIFRKCVEEKHPDVIATMLTAALFQLANETKWDLVLVKPDKTRVVVHCENEVEQAARAKAMIEGTDP